jgi:hypothetical protein
MSLDDTAPASRGPAAQKVSPEWSNPDVLQNEAAVIRKIKGMSEWLIVSHYENNYGGAVKRLNPIEEQLAELDYEKAAGFLINGLKREQLIAIERYRTIRDK